MKLSQAHGLATERRAEQLLQEFLRGIPAIEVGAFSPVHPSGANEPYDFMVTTLVHGQPKTMVVEVKHSGEPRFVRNAVDRLRSYLLDHRDAVPLVVAPYLSADARAICKGMKVGYLDFEGNCHLELNNLYIDREVAGKPVVERRALKAIFRPRSAQVLRALLGESPRAWRLVELSQAAGISLGQTSNVKSALLEREWAAATADGLTLTQPKALLEAWRQEYAPLTVSKKRLYTPLHGRELEDALQVVLSVANEAGTALLSSFSAAAWIAPYARNSSLFLYTDELALQSLTASLSLVSSAKGENVVVAIIEDLGVLNDCIVQGDGMLCTSPVQTYLDLWISGERGREAAEHLRRERLQWST